MQRLLFRKGKQRQMLLFVQKKLKLSQRKISDSLKIKRRTYRSWLSEEITIPDNIFESLCILVPSLKEFEIFIKRKLPSNWGQKKGGDKVAKSSDMIARMKKIHRYRNKKRIEIKNKMKINKNHYVKYLEGKKINVLPLFAVCLLTDGYVSFKENRVEYSTKDPVLKDTIIYFLHKLSKYPPLVYYSKKNVFNIRLTDPKIISKLSKLTKAFKKSPANNQSTEDYLKEKQPSIKFIRNYDCKTIKECIRLAFTTDGSISNSGILLLSCSNPKLCREWKEILDENGIKVNVWKNITSWSGFLGVGTGNINKIKDFQSIGGFVPGVKVSLKSKYFVGWEKNKVLKYIINRRIHKRAEV